MKDFIKNELACLRAMEPFGSDRYNELTNAIQWLDKNTDDSDLALQEFREAKNEQIKSLKALIPQLPLLSPEDRKMVENDLEKHGIEYR